MKLASVENHPLFNCGNRDCPLCSKAYSRIKIQKKIFQKNLQTDAVAPFIGRHNYPYVNVGILAPPEHTTDASVLDSPHDWVASKASIGQIVDYRSSLVHSRQKSSVQATGAIEEAMQLVGMAKSPTDIEINLVDKPHFRMSVDSVNAPMGPAAAVENVSLTENPDIDTKVNKVHYQKDLKAAEAMTYLYDSKFVETDISKILSVGSVGIGKGRKMVPTRWSITATDDTLSKHVVSKIHDNQEVGYQCYVGSHLGNYYVILCFPDVWRYELFEMSVDNPTSFMTDFENVAGRKEYAYQTAGGYYSVRLAVAEHFMNINRRASCLALRFVTGDYTVPLGVWVTREAARNAMAAKPIEFSSRELLLAYVSAWAKKKFNIDASVYFRHSKLLSELTSQTKLRDF